jgi:hypothetical protein
MAKKRRIRINGDVCSFRICKHIKINAESSADNIKIEYGKT